MHIPRGSVFGLVGENGAGKTTLIRHILGLQRPQTGSLQVFGLNPVAEPTKVLARLGYLSETRDLAPWMTVEEMIRFTGAFYPNWDFEYAEELRKQFDLVPTAKISTLSQGQLAKSALLAALAHRPELLVLDEPSSGLDPIVRRDILEAIIRTVAEEGRTVLFSSHLLDEIERVSDFVGFLHQGKLAITGTMDEVKSRYRVFTMADRCEGAEVLSATKQGDEWEILARATMRVGETKILSERDASLEDIFVGLATSQ
ncbi:MAG: ABC transporter ATP-binding protein [Limisphaerales bacterium]